MKSLPRFIMARGDGRLFVVHTECPRFVAEVVPVGPDPEKEAGLIYHGFDDLKAWAAGQPGEADAAIAKLMHDTGDFYAAYLDRKARKTASNRLPHPKMPDSHRFQYN